MHPQIRVVALFSAIALAACSTDAVAPERATAVSRFSKSAIVDQSGNYVVVMKGNGIASDFAQTVAKLGGTVTYANANAGFATVSGLSAASATQVGAISGVGEIQPDEIVSLAPAASTEADGVNIANPSINSVANPAAAAFNSWQ